ncbi:hypothetical protein GWK47_001503 [Chionoecetes opilio]|uniref:RRM domain-containing protein n=1 Tax=Chionoecetes opilio TaxID=41210 RepID=A0A8J4XTY1_CHIOP|nr:hypothetical protein GWK47_001503 [Chionoecetes opilio]
MAKTGKTLAVTVVVQNLPVGTSEHQLRAICENLREVLDVEIPIRTTRFNKSIYGFVQFSSLEAAHVAVRKLSGKTVETHSLGAQIARGHWRNCNEDTVTRGVPGEAQENHNQDSNMCEDDQSVTILQECRRQWQLHRRRHHDKGQPLSLALDRHTLP